MRPYEDTFPSLLPVQPRICHRDSPHPRSRSFPSLSLSLTASVNPYLTNLDEIKQGIMLGRGFSKSPHSTRWSLERPPHFWSVACLSHRDRARRFAASSFGALFICSGTETLRDRVKDTGEHLTVSESHFRGNNSYLLFYSSQFHWSSSANWLSLQFFFFLCFFLPTKILMCKVNWINSCS